MFFDIKVKRVAQFNAVTSTVLLLALVRIEITLNSDMEIPIQTLLQLYQNL